MCTAAAVAESQDIRKGPGKGCLQAEKMKRCSQAEGASKQRLHAAQLPSCPAAPLVFTFLRTWQAVLCSSVELSDTTPICNMPIITATRVPKEPAYIPSENGGVRIVFVLLHFLCSSGSAGRGNPYSSVWKAVCVLICRLLSLHTYIRRII